MQTSALKRCLYELILKIKKILAPIQNKVCIVKQQSIVSKYQSIDLSIDPELSMTTTMDVNMTLVPKCSGFIFTIVFSEESCAI